MSEIINSAELQLVELEKAIAEGNIEITNKILVQQAVILHQIGLEFVQKASENAKLGYKHLCISIAMKAFAQSRKSMSGVSNLTDLKPYLHRISHRAEFAIYFLHLVVSKNCRL